MNARALILTGYLIIGLALLALTLLSHRRPSSVARVCELAAGATRRRAGRLLVLVAWWWVGFHVLARSG